MRITIETDESKQTKQTSGTALTSVSSADADNAGASTADDIPGISSDATKGSDAENAGAPPQWLVNELEQARVRDDVDPIDAGAMSSD